VRFRAADQRGRPLADGIYLILTTVKLGNQTVRTVHKVAIQRK
jgi:hypothetical protein